MTSENTDLIYSKPHTAVKDFNFDDQVANVFPDMIKRSVPGYSTIIETIGKLSQRFAQDNSTIYDLGCSLGAATIAMRRNIRAKNCKIVAIDNSEAMVERCRNHVNAFKSAVDCQVLQDNIVSYKYDNASMMVLNFTLQFIEPESRTPLLKSLYNALRPGGLLVLSEKITVPTTTANDLLIDLHHDFKRANGYSELEIAQKRTALENVMRPESLTSHIERLQQLGFSAVTPWFQCYNFASFLAVK